ncbi:hypothetical protein LINGRAHAP2_LOCUS23016 [Linum grandiflorum]
MKRKTKIHLRLLQNSSSTTPTPIAAAAGCSTMRGWI